MPSILQAGDRILFQGDSITDAGRDRDNPHHLGNGYAMLAASWFQALYPERNVRFTNRGIGGDRTRDLVERWREDCLLLRPTWISLLVGINDTWRRYDRNDATSTEAYEEFYRTLLTRTMEELPGAHLILCEPFVLPTPPDRLGWRVDLDPKIAVVHKLAQEYDAILVPFDDIFAQAANRREPSFWAADGVHPTAAGHALMAQSWLKAVQAL
jgi:lysophospholipase L1-like esterase